MDHRLGSWEYSLDTPVEAGSRESQKDLLAAQDPSSETLLADDQLRTLISRKLSEFKEGLGDKERYILERRLLSDSPLTLQEIGAQWGISRERVRQIEERLKKKIRVYLVDQIPDFEPGDLALP
jgi:RNA polymerase sigma-32 factor